MEKNYPTSLRSLLLVALLPIFSCPHPLSAASYDLYSFTETPAKPDRALLMAADGSFYGSTSVGGQYNFGTIFKASPSGLMSTIVSSGSDSEINGPSDLTQGSDGNIYGTSQYGNGNGNYGSFFKLSLDGKITVLAVFTDPSENHAQSGVIQARDGNFYGTTYGGYSSLGSRTNYPGTIFKVTPSGTLTTLVDFRNLNNAGFGPSKLIQGTDGSLYGTATAYSSGAANSSIVFKLTLDGTLTSLATVDGAYASALVQGTDGNFYGTTKIGGATQTGTVFRVTPGGVATTLATFSGSNGSQPSELIQGPDGALYGTTLYGGSSNWGTVFRVTTTGALTTLVDFNGTNGSLPYSRLTLGRDGTFYGTTSGNLDVYPPKTAPGTLFKMTPSGNLTSFYFPANSGASFPTTISQAADGNFYGTSSQGGAWNQGTAFRLSPQGELLTVSFDGTHGAAPLSPILGKDGNIYGVANTGGSANLGAIFKISPSGMLTDLVDFDGPKGANPRQIVQGPDGNLYGVASYGGSANLGTFFRVTPSGALTNLVNFTGPNGATPTQVLVGTDGNFYGITNSGGDLHDGTVFKITPSGTFSTLASADGINISSPETLIQGSDGNLYGASLLGGTNLGGTVFKVTLSGIQSTVVAFNSTTEGPPTTLIQGADGNLYGSYDQPFLSATSPPGGVFEITQNGTLIHVLSFDLYGPQLAGLFSDFSGHVYGFTSDGGTAALGSIFQVK